MLKIRLTRIGKNRHASFRVVLTEHTNPVKGKFKELLGAYNPHGADGTKLTVKVDRIKFWMGHGVALSPTVNNLLIDQKIIEGKKVQSWKAPKKEVKPEDVTKTVATPVTPVAEVKPEEKPVA